MTKKLFMFSGGLDSLTMLAAEDLPKENLRCVYLDYDAKARKQELIACREICHYYQVEFDIIKLDSINEVMSCALTAEGEEVPKGVFDGKGDDKKVIPFRNGIMLSILTAYAIKHGFDEIEVGFNDVGIGTAPDASDEFAGFMKEAIRLGSGGKVSLLAPFTSFEKWEICKLALDCEAPIWLSYSCFTGREKHCGLCGSCEGRLEGFKKLGKLDAVLYEV